MSLRSLKHAHLVSKHMSTNHATMWGSVHAGEQRCRADCLPFGTARNRGDPHDVRRRGRFAAWQPTAQRKSAVSVSNRPIPSQRNNPQPCVRQPQQSSKVSGYFPAVTQLLSALDSAAHGFSRSRILGSVSAPLTLLSPSQNARLLGVNEANFCVPSTLASLFCGASRATFARGASSPTAARTRRA